MSTKTQKKSYGPTIRENVQAKELRKNHANKFVVRINSMLDNFFEQAKEACPTQDVSCVRLRLEGSDLHTLHIVAEYKLRSNGEFVSLGHESIKLSRGYSIDSWDGNSLLATFQVTFCPLIGQIVDFDVTIEFPSLLFSY